MGRRGSCETIRQALLVRARIIPPLRACTPGNRKPVLGIQARILHQNAKKPAYAGFFITLGLCDIAYARRPTAALTARAQMTAATSFARSTRINGATPAAKAAAGVMEATAMSCAQPHT